MTSHTRSSGRTWQHHMATFMKPFHCDLQPKIQQPHSTTCIRRSSHCRTQEEPICATTRCPQPPHTRGTFHRRPKPLYPKKHKLSCPNCLPKRSPCKSMQHPCRHYNALCNLHCSLLSSDVQSLTPPFVAVYCYPMCSLSHLPSLLSIVRLCDVNSHTTLHSICP